MKNYNDLIIPVADPELQKTVQAHLDNLTKPPGSLGKLEELALRFCMCRGDADAAITKKSLFVFAGDHGITDQGVAPFPKEVTVQMVHNMIDGGAAVSVMCRAADIDCRIVDMGVDGDFGTSDKLINCKVARGTQCFLNENAMTQEQCERAIQYGIDCADKTDADLCAIGEMGIGNTSSASALYALIFNKEGELTVGRGTGADNDLLALKREIITRAVKFHRENWDGSISGALERVGGFEIAGMTGFILGCALRRKPVVIDGFIATAAALCAIGIAAGVRDYLFFGHVSNEQFHQEVLSLIGTDAILHLHMRLGEGTGAALAVQIIEQALNCYHGMATFSSAGVSNRD